LTNKPRYHDAVSRSQATAARLSEEMQSGKDIVKYIPNRPVDQFPARDELNYAIERRIREIILQCKVPVAAEKFHGLAWFSRKSWDRFPTSKQLFANDNRSLGDEPRRVDSAGVIL
jgi:hypothetical protein